MANDLLEKVEKAIDTCGYENYPSDMVHKVIAQAAIDTIREEENKRIGGELDAYIAYFRDLEKLPKSYVLRGMTELKRRLLAASPLGGQKDA